MLLLGHLVSVVANPLVGQLSDNTRTRYGRRRPWIAAWTIPFGLFYACMWLYPRMLTTDLQKFGCGPAPRDACVQSVWSLRGALRCVHAVCV